VDAPYPIAVAARSGKPVLLPDLEAYGDRYPDIVDDTIAAGIAATASLPLQRADGSPVGAIGFAWTDPPLFDLKLENALRAVAELCTETVERAEQYEAEHELIVALQRRLLDDIPALDGVSTSARYLPAGRSASIGGDWYEGVVLDETRIAVVVGDVTGHGMSAAADMALIRGMVTALLLTGVPVADVFIQVSSVLRQRSGLLLATAALVVIDTATDTLTFATAGHPPPLLLLPNREVRKLDTANAPMIGVGPTRSIADTAPFPPGSHLVMFTDGLVERRTRPFITGVELAATYLASLTIHLDPSELIDSLLDALVADTTVEDDIALVVVERLAAAPEGAEV
jgi:serine phosphatase RsbU (regulator of sigma subunit)